MCALLAKLGQASQDEAMQPDLSDKSAPLSSKPRYSPGQQAWGLIALCVAVELTLMAADAGLIGTTRWRGLAYQYGAFWPGLLSDWRPNYAAQPATMFVSHAFLHGDFWHLAGNMATLFVLGVQLREWTSPGGFLVVYAGAAFGGALCFALLNQSPFPMVGASGALFGLAGALVTWEALERRRAGDRMWPMIRIVLILVALNVGMFIWLEGVLAWEAHLGGFLAGALVAGLMKPKEAGP